MWFYLRDSMLKNLQRSACSPLHQLPLLLVGILNSSVTVIYPHIPIKAGREDVHRPCYTVF